MERALVCPKLLCGETQVSSELMLALEQQVDQIAALIAPKPKT